MLKFASGLWNDRRRLIIVRGDDDTVRNVLNTATNNYRCELAVRNINLGKYLAWKCAEKININTQNYANFSFNWHLTSD